MWIGQPGVIAGFRDDPQHAAPWAELGEQGVWVDRWPNSEAWLDFIPPVTWCPGGQGIVAEHDFDGATVVVYEKLARPVYLSHSWRGGEEPAGLVPVVTFHCTRCHCEADPGERHMSASPEDRRTVGQVARQHMRPGRCQGDAAAARRDAMAATVARAAGRQARPAGQLADLCQHSVPDPGDMAASTCGEVRAAREHSARHARQPEGTRPR